VGLSNNEIIPAITEDLRKKLRAPISIIDLPIELEAVKSAERNQFYSTKLIAQALKLTNDYNGKVMLLVDVDLYIPIFTFIYGEAQLHGKHAIVSLCRLHEEFYTGQTNSPLLFSRTMKEIYHELGHNFGLLHCEDWDCVMHSSAGIEEVDIKGSYYCNKCLKEIAWNES
jgi:archaemetzincin